jgi:hypothetical protein
MYLSGEDFYLCCYSVFIILDSLGCSGGRYFKDYRKISFLIEFVKDNKLNYILDVLAKNNLAAIDKEYLFHSYSSGMARRSEVLKLLFTLEKKQFVSLERGKNSSFVNVTLNKGSIPDDFLSKDIFSNEYENIVKLKTVVKRLSTLTLEKMLERIYKDNGISTWAV